MLLCFSYLRRGVIVKQSDVERIVERIPAPREAAEIVAKEEEGREGGEGGGGGEDVVIFSPAVTTVKLGSGLSGSRRVGTHERESLLSG